MFGKYKEKIITIIAAASENNILGRDNKLIWHIPKDLQRFKRLTSGHSVIMGRKTFESLPKALPHRVNIVLTRNLNYTAENALVANTIEQAIDLTKNDNQPFVIGGGQIYSLFMNISNKIELTRVHIDCDGDAFFPKINSLKWKIIKIEKIKKEIEEPIDFSYITYIKK